MFQQREGHLAKLPGEVTGNGPLMWSKHRQFFSRSFKVRVRGWSWVRSRVKQRRIYRSGGPEVSVPVLLLLSSKKVSLDGGSSYLVEVPVQWPTPTMPQSGSRVRGADLWYLLALAFPITRSSFNSCLSCSVCNKAK